MVTTMRISFFAMLIVCAVAWNQVAAQTFKTDVSKKGTTAAPFLSISQGARATAMGSAFVAVADDQSALYWNPAGIATINTGVMFDHTTWFADIGYNFLGGSVNLGSLGTIGVSLTTSSVGDIPVTTVAAPEGTGDVYSVSSVALGIGYALRLTESFSIGFTPKFIYERIWKTSASAFAFDIGAKYATPFKGITLGMSISNFGQKMHMTGQNTVVLYDADPMSSGNNGRIPAELSTDQWALPVTFRLGVAYQALHSEQHGLVIAVDALHPSDDYESVNVGGEYTFMDFVSFRGGYKAIGLKETEESYTLGIGVHQRLMGNVALIADYCYAAFGRLGNIQKVTLGMTF
jgi:hypothetical protein